MSKSLKKITGRTIDHTVNDAWSQTLEALRTSATLRTADALETIAENTTVIIKNHVRMEEDLKWYKQAYSERGARVQELQKSNSALKGVITRLKNKQ